MFKKIIIVQHYAYVLPIYVGSVITFMSKKFLNSDPKEVKKQEAKKEARKGECKMALLAKPCPSAIIIQEDKADDFIKKSTEKAITPEFLRLCLKCSELMHGKGARDNGDRE